MHITRECKQSESRQVQRHVPYLSLNLRCLLATPLRKGRLEHRSILIELNSQHLEPSRMTRPDKTRQGKARQGKERQDKTRQDKTRQDKTRQDKTRQDKRRQDKTRQDKTRQDKTSQDRTRHDMTRGEVRRCRRCAGRGWDSSRQRRRQLGLRRLPRVETGLL